MNIITVSESKGLYEEIKNDFYIYALNDKKLRKKQGIKEDSTISEKLQTFVFEMIFCPIAHLPKVLFETGRDFIKNVIHLEFGKKMFGDLKDGLLSLVYGYSLYILLCLSPIISPVKSIIDFVQNPFKEIYLTI